MFGLSVVSSEGYSARQGLEELSEAALSVIETAKLRISWTDFIAFLLEVLHFNILFSQTLVSLIILKIFLCKIAKICIISLGLWFQFWFPSM